MSDQEQNEASNGQEELVKIREAIAAQEALRGILAEEEIEQTLARLRQQEARLSGSGAIAQGQEARAAHAEQGGLAIAGDVRGSVYIGPAPADSSQALNIYRRVLRQSCSTLPLRGINVEASDPTANQNPLNLVNVYVDLDTTSPLFEKESAHSERERRLLSAMEAVVQNRRLILLGDPGGGKSTFVNHLAHCLASHALQPEAGWLDHLSDWPTAEAEALPLLVILRDFAHSLPDPLPRRAEPHHLWDFIVSRLKAQNLAFAAEPIQHLLEQKQVLLLLDGLDEVPSIAQRVFVRDAVDSFINRYPDNRCLISCRTLSYQPPTAPGQPDLRLPPAIPAFELSLFDDEKINRFIEAWYAELVRLGTVRSENQEGLTRQLQQAVQRPDLWRLAPNPLLLTVMALVHTHQGRLPDARALLYEKTVDILLWRWEQVKSGGQGDTPRLRQLLIEAERTDMDLKKVLWQLAYEAHGQGGTSDKPEQLADIGELKLQKALATLKEGDLNWAAQMIETMKLRAGLLLERAPEVFSFPHRTFQEYLAGAHLAAQPNFPQLANRRAAEGVLWREVILLAVGRLVYREGDTAKPLALIAELCPGQQLPGDEAGWRDVWLAGDLFLEMGLKRVRDSALGRDLLERVRAQLVELVSEGHLSSRERAAAGSVLGKVGDPRPGVDLRPDGLPDIAWREVPPGPFTMGSTDDKLSFSGTKETPQRQVDLPAFQISQYPITNAQYAAFVQDGGYSDRWRHCWTTAGWRWKEDRTGPDTFGGAFDVANHPVVIVCWYEAVAFCGWLTERLRAAGELGPGDEITLPSESQWEKAARSTDGRIFPWGSEADPNRANYGNTGIGTTSAVGCFPDGASPYGVFDCAGNVLEWCRTKWEESYETYQDDNDLEGKDPRVLRGGAFSNSDFFVRCAYRFRFDPLGTFGFIIGFRVVMVRPPS